ncbi:phosphonate metabolism transcriptional regulator PhnF [Mesorhizobium sp. B4-1-4]|uniref:phosphonate metabolism transcriptional regulator PhnF n=1 Tax=Mesorhizobium sp. B4-1-4 TaxID=2589888 RepID=UPI001128EDEF|nr:phosphonate metabolism transcriptional regulator PhnF [Mesorhizobium sp. B4-1-4]UCI31756.1 phosphonate metabolism transcriptional regulator PhnF [Mesorhizobium sp. B4-1-4]
MQKEGINLWRQIGETLADEITNGVLSPGTRVPAAPDLALRFGVNRHTVLRALAHLQDEGLVRIERGRGAFVVDNPILYRMGARTRFEENLTGLNKVPGRELTALVNLPAPKLVAESLAIPLGETVTLVSLLGDADGIPLSYSHNYFPTFRLPGIREAFQTAVEQKRQRMSITACLKKVGVADFRRKSVRVRSRQPTADEARHLQMPPTESVLELIVINVDQSDVPIIFAETCFCSSRVEFVMDM